MIFDEFRIISKWEGGRESGRGSREKRKEVEGKRTKKRRDIKYVLNEKFRTFQEKGLSLFLRFWPQLYCDFPPEWVNWISEHACLQWLFPRRGWAVWKPTSPCLSCPISPSFLGLHKRGTEPSGRPWSLFLNPLYVLVLLHILFTRCVFAYLTVFLNFYQTCIYF